MKNLYEILQVSENASNEIIEKAYKVLAKKYHPDLQPQETKEKAEQKMKQINEAYEILSNEAKRKQYDEKLNLEKQEEERKKQETYYNKMHQIYKNQTNQDYEELKVNQKGETENNGYRTQEEIKAQRKMEQEIQKNMQDQYEQKYQQAYEDYLRSLGYKIKYKWTWKKYKEFLITIFIFVTICAILWLFPPTNKLIIQFYESNDIIKTIVDIIGAILNGIWNAICSIFSMDWVTI